MVVPIIVLVAIPIFLGIVYMPPFDQPPFDQPVQEEPKEVVEEPDVSILYFILMGIWSLYLIKILIQIKKGSFKVNQRY